MTQYHCKCLTTETDDLIAYWPLWEASGSELAEDISGHNTHGRYTNVTLEQSGIGDDRTSAYFNGSGLVNIFSSELEALFDSEELTLSVWTKLYSEAIWSDGIFRRAVNIEGDTSGELSINKSSVASRMTATFEATASNSINASSQSGANFISNVFIVSQSGNYMKYYRREALIGQAAYPAGAFSAVLKADACIIGARTTALSQPFIGYLAHIALWRKAMTDSQAIYISKVR